MDKQVKPEMKASDKLFKKLVYLCIILFAFAFGLRAYNKSLEKKEINKVVTAIENAFYGNSDYTYGNNVIKVNFSIKNENELFKLSKDALTQLADLENNSDIETLVVNARYANGDDFQSYDIMLKDIKRLKWDYIKDFDGFLYVLNQL